MFAVFAFEGFCAFVRFVPCCSFGYASKGALFAVVRCYCLRVGALVCACTLFEAVFCRLRGFFCFCNTLHTLHAFARLCGFSCSRVCSLFCAPSVRRFNDSEGQRMEASWTSHPPPWVRFIVCASRPRPAAISLQ